MKRSTQVMKYNLGAFLLSVSLFELFLDCDININKV